MWASYSRWDGSQADTFEADDVLEHLADELLNGGRSLESALRRLLQHGAEFRSGRRAMGLRELLERMRGARQQRQRQYNLASSLEDIRQQLEEVVTTEREGIQRRLDRGQDDGWRELLEKLARERLDQLDRLPDDLGGRLHGLRDYDFLDPEARQQFEDLLRGLQQQVLESTFRGLSQAIQSLTPEALRQIRDMVHDLNRVLDGQLDFSEFKRTWGHFFPGDIHNAEQLAEHLRQQMAQLEGLLNAMSPQMRRELEGLLDAAFRDQGLQAELARLAATMRDLFPGFGDIPDEFSGEESVPLREALKLMGELDDIGQAEKSLLRAVETNDPGRVDADQVGRLLGREAQKMTEQLQQLTHMLREAGLIERGPRGWELTPQATHKIGEQALREIFGRLRESGLLGRHALERRGNGVDRLDDTRRYAYGDPLSLDVQRTLMNALTRQGRGVPVRLTPDDFEVYDVEQLTTCSTLIMLDMSMSMMGRRFQAGRKVALALDSLIRSRFPRDHLQVVAFSYFVLPLEPHMLLDTGWIENGGGTNFQEALHQARLLLAPHKHGTRQVILITDGEPTTYYGGWRYGGGDEELDGLTETLREVARCTRERITINVFMMDRHHAPAESGFVRAMLRLNKGRAFFASADQLGEYVLLDYLAEKRRALSLH